MSKLNVDENGIAHTTFTPKLTQAPFATGAGVSTQSAAFAAGTTIIEVSCLADAFIAIGANPVAVNTGGASSIRLFANERRTLQVLPGQKVAFLTVAASTATVTEMA